MRLFGLIALALISLSANAQTPAPQDSVDIGSLTGLTYANKYFGLTLTIPTGWKVQDSSTKKRINDKGKELLTSDDPTKKEEIDRAVDSVLNLLTVTQDPIGEYTSFNAMFSCAAEKLPAGVKSDADYMAAVKNTLKYSQVPITIERDVYAEQIGRYAFSVIDFKTSISGNFVSQKYYAHIMKDYCLFFIISYQTDAQLKTTSEILRSVTFR